MSDSYYELVDDADPVGEKFAATDLVRSTWTAAIQHAAPIDSQMPCPELVRSALARMVLA